MAKALAVAKKEIVEKAKPVLGEVVMVFTKSSSHWCGLVEPKVITIEGIKFIEGTQVTGKLGHRMERKRTMIPLEHVASIVEFATEEDLWSEPQPKHLGPPEEERQYTPLTAHNHAPQRPQHGGGRPHRRDRRHRHPRNDNRFQGGHDSGHGNR